MTNPNDARRAHELVDAIGDGRILSSLDVDFLRSFLPERPKTVTLADLLDRVHDAWMNANPSDWGFDTPAEHHDWLFDLRNDLVHIIEEQDTPAAVPALPAHPEFLKTEADYESAPEGTIVACEDSSPWHKFDSAWLSTAAYEGNNAKDMTGVIRRVLRWGDGE